MSSAARGREFEAEVVKLLRAEGFEVTPNAKVAKPRQTDIFARSDEVDLLVEVKNRKSKIDVGDIGNLRLRLASATQDIVGVLFTNSALTRGAIESIEADRSREILVFVGDEIELLRSRTLNFHTLLDRKRRELRANGKAWFGLTTNLEFADVKFPPSNIEFKIGAKIQSYIESKSRFSGVFYSLEIPDSGWGVISGEGARLSIQLALGTVTDLRNILGYIHEKFGLTSNGMFVIQQSNNSWHGMGLENFLSSVENWRERYNQSRSRKFHHSEEVIYFDRFRNGWMELSTQQRIDLDFSPRSSVRYLHNSEIVIQLPGVPVNVMPYLNLCRYTQNDWANFQHLNEKETHSRRLQNEKKLEVIGRIIKKEQPIAGEGPEEKIVIGVVAKNPFYRKKSLPKELSSLEISLRGLSETELIICDLRDHHSEGDIVDYYHLNGFEVTLGSVGYVVKAFGTWNRMLKRIRR